MEVGIKQEHLQSSKRMYQAVKQMSQILISMNKNENQAQLKSRKNLNQVNQGKNSSKFTRKTATNACANSSWMKSIKKKNSKRRNYWRTGKRTKLRRKIKNQCSRKFKQIRFKRIKPRKNLRSQKKVAMNIIGLQQKRSRKTSKMGLQRRFCCRELRNKDSIRRPKITSK